MFLKRSFVLFGLRWVFGGDIMIKLSTRFRPYVCFRTKFGSLVCSTTELTLRARGVFKGSGWMSGSQM